MARTEKELLELYLIVGDDGLKREVLLKRLADRIGQEGDLTLNSQSFSGKELRSEQVLMDALGTIPFGAPKRLVRIMDGDSLTKDLQEALVRYCKQPNDTTVLVLCAVKLAKSTRLYKAFEAYNAQSVIDCGSKSKTELPGLVRGFAKGEGMDMSLPAATLLIELVGTSTVALGTEVKKLASLKRARNEISIDVNDVQNNCARVDEPPIWDLLNALALKDAALCLRLIGRMKGYTAIGIFFQCISRVREVLAAAQYRERGMSVAQGMGKQEWQVKTLIQASRLYSIKELQALIQQAPVIEQAMKSGADPDLLLTRWILDTCNSKKRIPA